MKFTVVSIIAADGHEDTWKHMLMEGDQSKAITDQLAANGFSETVLTGCWDSFTWIEGALSISWDVIEPKDPSELANFLPKHP